MIHIEDKIMGSSKTKDTIELINKRFRDFPKIDVRYLVVVPLLTEVTRYIEYAPYAKFVEPLAKFDGRIDEFVSKKTNLMHHLLNGRNIVTTHSLFSVFDEDIAKEITRQDYFVVIDETLICIEPLPVHKDTREALLSADFIKIDTKTNRVSWTGPIDPPYKGLKDFHTIRGVLLNKEVYIFRDNLFIFQTPLYFFQCAKNYHILSYRFEASSNMRLYFMLNNIPHNVYCYPDYKMKQLFKELITFVDPPKIIQSIQQHKTTFSGNYWKSKKSKDFAKIRESLGKCMSRRDKVLTQDVLYSCIKGISTVEAADRKGCHVTPKGYAKSIILDEDGLPLLDENEDIQYRSNWLPFNKTATNDLKDKNYIVYLHNVFFNVNINKWLLDNNIIVNEEEYALSTIIQCIWRTAIRDKQPIRVMIFSNRMKRLLIDWLDSTERISEHFNKYVFEKPFDNIIRRENI